MMEKHDNIKNTAGKALLFVTTDENNMFTEKESICVSEKCGGEFAEIIIDGGKRYQPIDGFGASFTDSAAYLINQKLDDDTKESLMVKLFDPEKGIGLSMLRQPMGASDFARTIYSYNDLPEGEEDFNLEKFSVGHDMADVIPLMKRAKELNPNVLFMASPWSPPGWMKTSGNMKGGSLRPECYDVYAEYFVKYIKAYKEQGLDIYAVTPQNEPLYLPKHYPGCKMEGAEQAEFIQKSLGPALHKNNLKTKLLCYDHNWDKPDFPETVLSSPASEYVDGVAWHWYGGDASAQTKVWEQFPNKEAHFTEASGGEWIPPFTKAFMAFMVNIIKTLNNYSRSVVLWNMALDENNGPVVPGFGRSTCRGIVKVNQQTGELTYNLDYYALSHFSKYIRQGAVRVATQVESDSVYATTCLNSDGSLVIVAANNSDEEKNLRFISDGRSYEYTASAKSAATLVIR